MKRSVYLLGTSLLCPDMDGYVSGFDPVKGGIPRKNIRTMTRAVQLGVVGVAMALAEVPNWQDVPPPRRGLFVGGSPQSGDASDLQPALDAAGPGFDLHRFATQGIPLIPPLWLVKGLSNNILGYAAAQHDLQGDNGNWCDGPRGGAVALCNAVHAVAEGRVDLAIAGAADCLIGADALVGGPCAEGAAFVVLGTAGSVRVDAWIPTEEGAETSFGALGAAAVPVGLVRRWRAQEFPVIGGGLRIG